MATGTIKRPATARTFNLSSTGTNRNAVLHAWCATLRPLMSIDETVTFTGNFQSTSYSGVVLKATDNVMFGRLYAPNSGSGFYFRDSSTDTEATSDDLDLGTKVFGSNTTTSISVPNNTVTEVSRVTLTKGSWIIVGCGNWNSNSSGYRQMAFGSGASPARALATTTNAISGKDMYQQVTRHVSVSSSETIVLYALQNSGSAITIYPSLWAVKVGC